MKKSKIFLALFSLLLVGTTLLVSSSALAATKTATKTVTKTTVKKTAVKPVLNGQVISATAKKVVVKSGTKNYNINVAKTKVSRQTTATTTKVVAAKDLKKGETVSIFGTLSKTTVTATSIIANIVNPKTASTTKNTTTFGTSTPPSMNHASGTPEFGHNNNHASGTPEFNMNDKGLFGTVTAVNDSSLTVTSMGRGGATSTDAYTITLSSATVYSKDQATATISDVVVGSKIMISGDVDTTNKTVTATKIDVMTKMPDRPDQTTSSNQ